MIFALILFTDCVIILSSAFSTAYPLLFTDSITRDLT